MVARVSRPAIAWQRIGASGLMFLNAPGVVWKAGGEASPVNVTNRGVHRDMASDSTQPPALPFLQVPTP